MTKKTKIILEKISGKESITLTSYQEDLKKRLQGQHGMVVSWGLGSGKTIGSIAAADQFGSTKVIAPASLRENFRKELKAYKPSNKFSVESYEHFVRNPEDVAGKTVIFDEAHRLRTSGSARSQAAQALTDKAQKVLLLTGTPIQNKPHEIAPLVNIAAGKRVLPTDEKQFNYHYTRRVKSNPGPIGRAFGAKPKDTIHAINLDDFTRRVSPYVSFHSNTSDPSMPTVHQRNVNVEMTEDQVKTYTKLQRQLPTSIRRRMEGSIPTAEKDAPRLNAFLSATRQISNTGDSFVTHGRKEYSPKLKSIVHNVTKSPGQSLIYSNYLDSGVTPLSELLTKANIRHGVFTGKLGDRERKSLVNAYNNKKIKALIVSSSGGEGLDLKNTRQVHITEPHWNEAKIEQVVGRSARKGSHIALPEAERNVDVFRYNSLLPERRTGFLWMKRKRPVSADQYLEGMSQRKTQLNNEFLNALQKKAESQNVMDYIHHAINQARKHHNINLTVHDIV